MTNQLILPEEIEKQIASIMAPLKNPKKWMSYGLPFAPFPSAIIRMEGLPGTGKTAIANMMARKLRTAPMHIDFSTVASPSYGETEQKILAAFKAAHETETNTLIFEESDALFWSRDKINEDTVLALGIVNTLLTEIDRFVSRQIPSLLIFTTNYPALLDSALESRFDDVIKLSPPVGRAAEKMWKSKLPKCFDWEKTDFDISSIYKQEFTPRQMEKMILKACRIAMIEDRNPNGNDLLTSN